MGKWEISSFSSKGGGMGFGLRLTGVRDLNDSLFEFFLSFSSWEDSGIVV